MRLFITTRASGKARPESQTPPEEGISHPGTPLGLCRPIPRVWPKPPPLAPRSLLHQPSYILRSDVQPPESYSALDGAPHHPTELHSNRLLSGRVMAAGQS
ncbi:hypothetical protein SRHO_G00305890 [Serrasalmus rhombeus]